MSEQIPVYTKWEDIPEGIATKTTLSRDFGLKLTKEQKPVAQKKRYNHRGKHVGYYDLYAMSEAKPKRKPTEAQLKALEKARYMAEKLEKRCSDCNGLVTNRYGDAWMVTRKEWIDNDYDHFVCGFCEDKYRAIQWAKHIMELEDVVILDTETTDLHGEIIEIAVIDMQGNTILDQRIKPLGGINPEAEMVHGISLEYLADCPTFAEVYEDIKQAIEQKIVVIYNADFDRARLEADCDRHDLEPIKFAYDCAMKFYAQYYGEWSSYWGSYKWQPLNGTHGALGDCVATLDLIKKMSNANQSVEIP